MAVNVDTVYKTVLLILNKEQRGYITPEEFNKIGSQVQLEIFNEYFESLNQQLRVPANDSEYSDRIKNLEEKIAIFQEYAQCSSNDPFILDIPVTVPPDPQPELYKLGTVIYKDEKEVQYIQPNELLEINLSPITKPSVYWPVYTYKNFGIYVYPKTITSDISCTYIRKPYNVVWAYKGLPTTPNAGVPWTTGPYIYDSENSVQFDLHPTEQTNLITRILLYSGIVIKDPLIIQAAVQQIQTETVNSKS